MMRTFILIHGAGDVGWSWHLVAAEIRSHGHTVYTPDLPADDDSLSLTDYADAVVNEVGQHDRLTVVGHSFGGFTAPLVAAKLNADHLIYLAGMIPFPGETPGEWWGNTGYSDAVTHQAEIDGGLTGNEDPLICFYHDVPPELSKEAMTRERSHPSSAAMAQPWPLETQSNIHTRFILCRDDRCFPAEFFRRLVPERLGITPEEIDGSHCVMLSRPKEVTDLILAG